LILKKDPKDGIIIVKMVHLGFLLEKEDALLIQRLGQKIDPK
jgi:hypothetical protein